MRYALPLRRIGAALWFVAASLVWEAYASAGTTGAIQGFATDPSLHPLAGVVVAAAAPSGSATTVTAADGFFALNGLPLDTYTVTFYKDGYATQVVSGVTAIQDQAVRINAKLRNGLTTVAHVSARNPTSLFQPSVTADSYVVDESRLATISGTPQDLGANALMNPVGAFTSLPGVTGNPTGTAAIRGGLQGETGWQYDGVDSTNVLLGIPVNIPTSLNGVHSVQLSTGGYDVSEGNTNAGIINEVIKRGTYPPKAQATFRVGWPAYAHEVSIEYGGATPNNRFSYYAALSGMRDAIGYGDLYTLLPVTLGAFTFNAVNDDVLNLFYRFGRGDANELQVLSSISTVMYPANELADPAFAPYASNNGNVQARSDPFGLRNFSTFQSSYLTLYPGQRTYAQNIGYADTGVNSSSIGKLDFRRRLGSSSFFEVRLFRTRADDTLRFPYNFGSFTDFYQDSRSTATGASFDYTKQVDVRNELSLGGQGAYYTNEYVNGAPSLEPFFEPLEDLGCLKAARALGKPPIGGCYIAPFNAAIDGRLNLGLATDAAHAPMQTYISDFSYTNDPMHRWNTYIKDRFQPSDRMTITFGLRWDKESVPLPHDVSQLNASYYIDNSGNVVTVPGAPIGTDVTAPSQLSPRIAASYQLSGRDAIRFSYGENIEFVPLTQVEQVYQIPSSLKACSIANGCFNRLPGFGTTNHVTNLYQQILLDLNTNNFTEYTPLLPQRALNLDFSYERDLGRGASLRVSPYYRRGRDYVVANQSLLFTLPGGTPVLGPAKNESGGINENTGVEFALQRNAEFGLSGLLDATYDNTLANYDAGPLATNNPARLAAGHLLHVTYTPPVLATLNLAYNTRSGFHASSTLTFESGYRYGVGKKTFVFGPSGSPVQVLNTDLASASGAAGAYYLTNPANPGTVFAPNIVASRGTPEGDDPGTLFAPAVAMVNLTLAQEFGRAPNRVELGIRITNLLSNYSPLVIGSNPSYGFSGYGNNGWPSGVNGNACAPHQTYACEPFQYNFSPFPYEDEPSGLPRTFTLFVSVKV